MIRFSWSSTLSSGFTSPSSSSADKSIKVFILILFLFSVQLRLCFHHLPVLRMILYIRDDPHHRHSPMTLINSRTGRVRYYACQRARNSSCEIAHLEMKLLLVLKLRSIKRLEGVVLPSLGRLRIDGTLYQPVTFFLDLRDLAAQEPKVSSACSSRLTCACVPVLVPGPLLPRQSAVPSCPCSKSRVSSGPR